MQGIELSRAFYTEVVRPWLGAAFPGLPHAAALIGYGSELLGLDDAMSQDHNWGPRVLLFVDSADFARVAEPVVSGFVDIAPPSYQGHPIGMANRPHPPPYRRGG